MLFRADAIPLTDAEILEELTSQQVMATKRFTRRNGDRIINTPSIILTLNATKYPD